MPKFIKLNNNEPFLQLFGKKILVILAEFGNVSKLFLLSLKVLVQNRIFWRNTLIQMESIGVQSLPIVIIISTFAGMVISLQLATIFAIFGLTAQLGQGLALAFGRELGPILTGVVVAGRVASSIAAEIGSMKVTEQIDALETLSTDPVAYLAAPRILAGAFMLPALVIFSDLSGMVGGFAVASIAGKIPVSNFIDGLLTFATFWDFAGGVIKSIFFGLVISTVATYRGLVTENGAVGVGKATTQAVVHSTIVIFIINYFLSMFLYNL